MLGRRAFLGIALSALARPSRVLADSVDHPALVYRLQLPRRMPEGRAPVVSTVAAGPDLPLAAAGDDHRLHWWDLDSGQLLRTSEGHGDWVSAAVYAPTGKQLATAGRDRQVIVWRVADGAMIRRINCRGSAAAAVQFNADGSRLAVSGFREPLELFDATSGEKIAELDCPCRDMRTMLFSPDGRYLAGGGRNGRLRLWDITGSAPQSLDIPAHAQRLRGLAYSADGQQLVTVGEDGQIRVWHVTSGQHLLDLPRQRVKLWAVAYVAPQRLATAGTDNRIVVWDTVRAVKVDELPGHTGTVTTLAVSEPWLISGSFDATVCVWSLERMRLSNTPHISRSPST